MIRIKFMTLATVMILAGCHVYDEPPMRSVALIPLGQTAIYQDTAPFLDKYEGDIQRQADGKVMSPEASDQALVITPNFVLFQSQNDDGKYILQAMIKSDDHIFTCIIMPNDRSEENLPQGVQIQAMKQEFEGGSMEGGLLKQVTGDPDAVERWAITSMVKGIKLCAGIPLLRER